MNKLNPFIIASLLYCGQPTIASTADVEKVLRNINDLSILLGDFLAHPKNKNQSLFGHYGQFESHSHTCAQWINEIGESLNKISRVDIKQYQTNNQPEVLKSKFKGLLDSDYSGYSVQISSTKEVFYDSLSKYQAIADFFTEPKFEEFRSKVVNARQEDPESKVNERQIAIESVGRVQQAVKPVRQQLSNFASKSQLTIKKGKASIPNLFNKWNERNYSIYIEVDTYAPPAQPTETKPQSNIFTTPKVLNVSSKPMNIKVAGEGQSLQQGEIWQKTLTLDPGASAQLSVECEGFSPITIDLKKLPSGTLYLALDAGRFLFGSKTPQSSKIDFKPMSKAEAQKQYPKWVK